ncbi:Esterase E4 [Portunus trituberculatus]|uniref:Esterase E4 n=1 Tax=Portunus trituberculatus TaxID=210409 RepID=A0A5B7HNU1_PORTR|nr:Esterase E4 [Portunus trituberculatus]
MWPSSPQALVAALLLAITPATAGEVPLVDTEDGQLSGIVEESVKGRIFFSFYGIPYARPPLDKLRFTDPKPAPKWEGTRDASVPAAPCLQCDLINKCVGKEGLTGKEDCLYLSVFTPKVKGGRLLPVMVWIHGGGFYYGSTQHYLPHILIDQDVVLVLVQYRLGVLGRFPIHRGLSNAWEPWPQGPDDGA